MSCFCQRCGEEAKKQKTPFAPVFLGAGAEKFFFVCDLRPFNFVITVFPLGVLYPEHAQPAFEKI